MYGNMSSVEKAMNRNELLAFKNYDNKNYTMIPGVTSNKQSSLINAGNSTLSPKKNFDQNSKFHQKVNQLNQIGYNEKGMKIRLNEPHGRINDNHNP